MTHETLTDVLVSVVGIETTVLLVLIIKLGSFLHAQVTKNKTSEVKSVATK